MKYTTLNRRDFLKKAGMAGTAVAFASSPWLSVFADSKHTDRSVARIGIIGPGGSRGGRYLMQFLANDPKVEITGLCDTYQHH